MKTAERIISNPDNVDSNRLRDECEAQQGVEVVGMKDADLYKFSDGSGLSIYKMIGHITLWPIRPATGEYAYKVEYDAVADLVASNPVYMVPSKGEKQRYEGERTMRAIKDHLVKMRFSEESAMRHSFVIAKVFSHKSEYGDVYVDIETGIRCFL